MVLGAGLGSRLKPFTTRTPKPLIPVLGVPCIEFSLLNLREAGVSDVIINVHAHSDQMRMYFESDPVLGMDLHESNEDKLLLGSAGGFRKALPFFKGQPFFSMNADVLHLAPLQALAEAHARLRKERGVVMTLVLASGEIASKQTGAYTEIQVDQKAGIVMGLGGKKVGVPFYTGSAIFEPEAFEALTFDQPAEFAPEVLGPAIRAGKVGFIESDALWLDVGSPELWKIAIESLQAAKNLPPFLSKRLKEADPTLGGRFELGKNKIRLDDIEYEIEGLRRS